MTPSNDNTPKISILIPTYNQEMYILDAVNSALKQAYSDFEVIVGDDQSTDATQEIMESIQDKRLKYIRNDRNLGRTENYRNLLYDHATGDFVVNLDGDDYFTNEYFLDHAIQLIGSDENVVMVIAQVTTKSNNYETLSKNPSIKEIAGLELLKRIPRAEYMIMHMGVLYDRQKALGIDFYRSSAISSDWESLYRLALLGKVKYLNENIGVWRIHGKNETGSLDMTKLLDNLSIWSAIYSEVPSFGISLPKSLFFKIRCEAFFALASCVKVSSLGNRSLLNFLYLLLRERKLALIKIIFTPALLLSLLASFLGYYRINKKDVDE